MTNAMTLREIEILRDAWDELGNNVPAVEGSDYSKGWRDAMRYVADRLTETMDVEDEEVES